MRIPKLLQVTPKFAGAKFFNLLPDELRILNNSNMKLNLKKGLQIDFVDEFLSWKDFVG